MNGTTGWVEVASAVDVDLEDVYFADERIGWVAGRNGTIARTDDGGAGWSVQRSRPPDYLRSVHFRDTERGWAAGGFTPDDSDSFPAVLLSSSDGGGTWDERNDVLRGGAGFSKVQFRGDAGWVFGETFSLSTRDGGATWSRIPAVFDAFFLDAEVGFALRREAILKSDDAGASWWSRDVAEFTPEPASLLGLHFADGANGWIVGTCGWPVADALVLRTDDRGVHFEVAARIPGEGAAFEVFFVDAVRGWLIARSQREDQWSILHSADGGATWAVEYRGSRPLSRLVATAAAAFAVGAAGLVLRTDLA
jgi:photosystem II stability/assembly factor-like uncharacterized protein